MITSSRHDKVRDIRRKKILGFIFGAVLLILIFRSPVEHVLSGILQYIARPFFTIENSVRDVFSEYSYVLTTKNSLLKENARLNDTLELTALDAYSREILRKENDELKIALHRNPGRAMILARVLANPGFAPYDSLIIDVGNADGLTAGMKVFIDGDFVIGEVSSVFARSAVVTLYSSSGSELPVTIHQSATSSIPAIAYGIGGGNFRSTLPKGIDIKKGDIIDIPSIAPQYIGVVDGVTKLSGSSLQEVYFTLPINIFTLRYLYIATAEEIAPQETPQ